ncbi:MAG: excinuclease ABC subunit B [Candidatus Levybacteria bacterium RIFCSPHIGHO2_12_FULL_37_12]|nr:MAG: excinuclease ABC subunit B [Candidatus Levybacteria bacterium RIFCSPHIGHO2_12_FULL_37_12]
MKFKLVSKFKPTGDQPQAINKLTKNVLDNIKHQVLLGVTGSGKTFTLANVIEKVQKPTLVVSHNKTLAAQLYQEFRDFFPNNAVCYFVSYYDYYQPEAYIPQTDTYIEKETEINEEIDKLRLSATASLLTRKDVIVVASVSCIYNLGSPVEYGKFVLELKKGMKIDRKSAILRLSDLQYDRDDYGFARGTYRLRGETIDVYPAYSDYGIKIDIADNFLEELTEFNPLTGNKVIPLEGTVIYPAKHYMTDPRTYNDVFKEIRKDTSLRVDELKNSNRLLEAHRLAQRTNFDLQMIREIGYVNGIENYSRYFDGRKPGDAPYTLLDYFKEAVSNNWLCLIDESHITLPQIRGMYNGDRARKEVLIDYGFRLPSALDNRPLKYDEFSSRAPQLIYISATPNDYELSLAKEYRDAVAQQLIRPTGLLDPKIKIRSTKNQIDDLMKEILKRALKKERVLVTTLTKRMAEDLSSYLEEKGIKVSYLHSDIATLERQDVLDKLRLGEYDVIVGINLLREGLDLPEVSLVVILDADKEGFLRSKTSLIQTMGRAARHIDSEVILYADSTTGSMREAIKEVNRRRNVQLSYNKKHKITPKNIEKEIREKLVAKGEEKEKTIDLLLYLNKKEVLLPDEREMLIKKLGKEMKKAALELDFETAVLLRDKIREIKNN